MASFWRQPLTFTVVMEEQSSGRSPEGCSHSMHFGGAQSRYSKLSFMPARHVLHVSAWLMNSSLMRLRACLQIIYRDAQRVESGQQTAI